MPARGSPRRRSAFGEILLAARNERGLTQKQAAERIGISRARLSAWENHGRPHYRQVQAISEVLEMSTRELTEALAMPDATSDEQNGNPPMASSNTPPTPTVTVLPRDPAQPGTVRLHLEVDGVSVPIAVYLAVGSGKTAEFLARAADALVASDATPNQVVR